jgi:hypothetical protein
MSPQYLRETIRIHLGYICSLEVRVVRGNYSDRLIADLENMRETVKLEMTIALERGIDI